MSRDFRAYLKKPQRGFASIDDIPGAIEKLKRETDNHLDPLLPDLVTRYGVFVFPSLFLCTPYTNDFIYSSSQQCFNSLFR